jgi:hypothetical protein
VFRLFSAFLDAARATHGALLRFAFCRFSASLEWGFSSMANAQTAGCSQISSPEEAVVLAKAVETLREENKKLRELIIYLSTIAVRNVVDRP